MRRGVAAAAARAALLALAAAGGARPAGAQSLLDRTPNVHGTWTMPRWTGWFVLSHRFELVEGGDEVINVPGLTLALGLPARFSAGLDYTSNGESVEARLGASEVQYWLKHTVPLGRRGAVAATAAYHTATTSVDGALTGRLALGPIALVPELRAFTKRWDERDAGLAVAGGAIVRLTPRLALVGDVGRAVDAPGEDAAWSAGIALAVPGSPHTLSAFATNTGATSLQSASRAKRFGPNERRWGFAFTVPLGTRAQWAQLVRRDADRPRVEAAGDTVRVFVRMVAYERPEVRVRAGQVVQWVNLDPIEHTATADDGTWDSGPLARDGRWSRRFDTPGRWTYHCRPHPQMRGVVIVE